MSGSQSQASQQALSTNRNLAEQYYGVALPALQARQGAINQQLATGEPQYLKDAYAGQRAGLSEGLAAAGGASQARAMEGAGAALSGGNQFANLNPTDMGSMLANALYGSKFQEGQANLNQQFNLMSMGMGGAGSAGNAALQASGNQLNAIGMLPKYNNTYANVLGVANLAGGLYGAGKQAGWFAGNPGFTSVSPNDPFLMGTNPAPYSYPGSIGG